MKDLEYYSSTMILAERSEDYHIYNTANTVAMPIPAPVSDQAVINFVVMILQ